MYKKQTMLKNWIWPAVLILGAMALYGRGVFDQDTFVPDADRIAMDGIYFRDLIIDMPFSDLWGYTTSYFARYPALSIGYRLPFFQFVEGIFYLMLGASMSTAKISVLAFAAFGIFFFYRLVNRTYGTGVAVWSALLFITTPFVFRWARLPMQEIPTLAMISAAMYYFYRYTETQRKRTLIAFFITFVCALYTKYNSIFLLLFFPIYLTLKGKTRLCLKKEVLIGLAFLIIALVPLAVITMKFGSLNIEQTVSAEKMAFKDTVMGVRSASRVSVHNLLYHIRTIYRSHLTPAVVVLAAIGLILAAFKRDRRAVLFLVWIASVYVMVTYSRGKSVRYPIYWIPPLCVMAASVIENNPFKNKKPARMLLYAVLTGAVIFQVHTIYAREPIFRAEGYREAARYVTENPKGYTIFF